MKDLEIRGAGQPARRRAVRAHRGRRLRPVRADGRRGGQQRAASGDGPGRERPEVKVELPVDAHIPHDYVPGERLRLEAYTRIAGDRLRRRHRRGPRGADRPVRQAARAGGEPAGGGPLPRSAARRAGLTDVTLQGKHVRFAPVSCPGLAAGPARAAVPEGMLKQAAGTLLVPVPKTRPLGGQPLRDLDLLKWCGDLVEAMFLESMPVK